MSQSLFPWQGSPLYFDHLGITERFPGAVERNRLRDAFAQAPSPIAVFHKQQKLPKLVVF
jgi:hypothetical protein